MSLKQAIIRNSLDLLAADQHDELLKKPPTAAHRIDNTASKKALTRLASQAYSPDVKSKVLTAPEVIGLLRKKQGDLLDSEFAAELGITKAYLCDLYKGRRTPGEKILSQLGLVKREQEPTYECA